MTKKVLINKQGKAIINKHHNNFSNLTPDEQLGMFRHFKDENNEDVYLKGEIVIDTDPENPSIYILNNNNKVVKISGNGSDGEGSYDDTEIKQLIKVVSDDIKEVSDDLNVLRGSDLDKSAREIATDEASKAVTNLINGAPEAYDTLKEISDWIIGGENVSGVTAADMLVSIDKNKTDIANEVTARTDADSGLQSQIDDIKDDYLTSSDKVKLNNAITAETYAREVSISGIQTEINTIKEEKESDKEILTNSIKGVTDIVTGHTETISSIQQSVSTLRGDFDVNTESVGNSITTLTNDITIINSELDNINTTIKNVNNDVININTTISTISDSLDGVSDEVKNIKEDITNKYNETNNTISGVTEEINTIKDDISSINNDITGIQETIAELTDTTSENTNNITNIIDTQIPLINETVSGITTEVTNIKEEISGYTESIDEISKTTKQLNEKVDGAVTNFNTLSDTVSTFENSINTNTENINTLLTNVSANTETLNVLTGDEEGSINRKIIDTKTEIDSYTINGISISQSPTFTSGNLYISEDYQIIGDNGNIVDEGRITPKDKLTEAFVKLESMLLTTILAITASLNDLEARIGNPSQYDEEGNLIKESSGLFKRIEELEK